jgi:hypothetical protein
MDKMAKITRQEAKKLGINFNKDFFTLSHSQVLDLNRIGKLTGYQRTKNATGSYGRYFFYHLAKLK